MRYNASFLTLVIACSLINCRLFSQESEYTNSVGMKFVLIKPGKMIVGKFQPTVGKKDFRGNPLPEKLITRSEEMAAKDAMPGFTVILDTGYYIGSYEITQGQW